ncbi:uncharacterized protein Z518_07977 [Rhinocladiella mackenziei CBS 650.93]|uniref:Rhinocladiella mackenziei CBS 650.93 unplaced genomic scaffold supercont1.6, whole genome shotgun sequence n=1 Tax=Rhinocladiella mackenziei CBS 650.93 TaxID=1442369 RepID=A0A0D2GUV5_9EURO|nr:uncharacterized protein Z518_07977 [Rhinocladiella mackenziei CBS 650.93]KIX02038.1 hypothetical protein Z518_07977 [Rhinocladiella mackenziei CBS 650.93]
MSQAVGSNESQDASVETASGQAATDEPTGTDANTKVEKMTSNSAPADSNGDQQMTDAVAGDDNGDSEAETLIQSPEKQRTITGNTSVAGSVHITDTKDEGSTTGPAATEADSKSRKRKRSIDDVQDETTFSTSSRRSSPLSSPQVPPHSADSDSDLSSHIASQKPDPVKQKRENQTADSDDQGKPVQNQTRRRRPSDILPPISKHRTKNNSGGVDPGSSERRETRSATYPRHSSHERSPSPRPPIKREHRRGVSTQLTHGDVERKKRGRPPAIHTRRSGSADHHAPSISSDESDSPRRSRPALHKFSSADHDTMSPAKATGPRKWRDKNGRTFLSRACNNNDLAAAKARFAERPEDLNLADNAGNTPLQIAALEGFTDIVKFLLENKCEVDTTNIDKETPLIDAVENGHVEVVRLLLQYGANPRLGNAKGDEPYELVPQDDENYEEIRKLLADAKENQTNRRISSDHNEGPRDGNSSRAASAASPRDSPPIIGPRSPPALTSRRRTGRSESTRNDLLWQANTQENLTRLAAKGDVQGVANILNILQKAETESLIAAAKAGHEEVLQYLLGMGDPEPDPEPLRHIKPGFNTPILAAIGRGHPEVVKLLVEQSGFNPTRRILKGRTYFEIAAERRGEQWQKEYEILKGAYDKHAAGKSRKVPSPRVTRDSDKMKSRASRRSQSPIPNKLRNSSSPNLMHKTLPNKSPQSLHKDRDRESGSADGAERRKHPPSKRETLESSVAVSSDQDQTVSAPRKGHVKKRSQSDLPPPPHLDSEGPHRRRRLVTGKEHRRRRSIVAEESSDEAQSMVAVKSESRPGAALKRTRDSISPGPAVTEEGENGRSTVKKRRTLVESSPEETRPGPKRKNHRPPTPTREPDPEKPTNEEEDSERQKPAQEASTQKMDVDQPDKQNQVGSTESLHGMEVHSGEQAHSTETTDLVKTEPMDTGPSEAELDLQKQEEARKAEEAKRLEEERIAAQRAAEKAAEERRLAEEIERRRKAEEEAALRKKEEEERQERIKRELEERQRRQEEQLRQQRLEFERRRREALPIVLNKCAWMIDNNDPTVKSEAWLSKFLPLFTVRTAQLDPDAPVSCKDDLWIPNFQVAGLLVTKDLNLRSYTSLEKRPVNLTQRHCLWKVSRVMLSYEYETNGFNTPIQKAVQREEEERPKFYAMEELFWVKLSDFEDQIFRHPQLATLRIKKQPISLRMIGPLSPTEQSPQPNGISQPSPKLTNGINPHTSPTVYSNGYTR